MFLKKSPPKKVLFFQIAVLLDHGQSPVTVPWAALVEHLATASLEDRTFDRTVYELHSGSEADLPIVAVHEGIRRDFLSLIGEKSVEDAMDKAVEDGNGRRLANSTAIAVLPSLSVVAVITGTGSSPRPPRVVREMLEQLVSAKTKWQVTPLPDPAKIEELRRADGVIAFSTRMSTTRNLLTPERETGFAHLVDRLSDELGGDIDVSISVRLAPSSRDNPKAKRRFRRSVLGDIARFGGDPSSGAKVTAVTGADVQEDLNLVAQKMGIDVDLPPQLTEGRRFSELVAALLDVTREQESRIAGILRG